MNLEIYQPRPPLSWRIWFFSLIVCFLFGLFIPFEALYPWLTSSDWLMSFVIDYLPSAISISSKTEFAEYATVYIIWISLIGLSFQVCILFLPYLKPRKMSFSKRQVAGMYIGIPLFIFFSEWMFLCSDGGSVLSYRRNFWTYIYGSKGVFSFVFAMGWCFINLSTLIFIVSCQALYKKDFIIK